MIFRILALLCLTLTGAHAQLLIANASGNNVDLYNSTTGALLKANFVTGLSTPQNMIVVGNNLFVVNYTGSIGEYNATTGAVINANFTTGLDTPYAITSYNGNLYVTTGGATSAVKEINGTTGAVIGNFTTGSYLDGATVVGSTMYVSNGGSSTIESFNVSTGALINSSLVSGITSPQNLIVTGSDIFAVTYNTNSISEYTLSGTLVTKNFITGLDGDQGFALNGNNLYISNRTDNVVGEYSDVTGAAINSNLINGNGLNSPIGVLFDPLASATPEPRAWMLSLIVLLAFVGILRYNRTLSEPSLLCS